jgi:hypothetical protein
VLKKLLAFVRRRKALSAVLAAVAVIVVGSVTCALWPPPVVGPPIRVVYWGSSHWSPGAGAGHTSTSAFEIDLEHGRWRWVRLSGSSNALGRLRWKLWQKMDEEHYREVRTAVENWIAGKPPDKLACLMRGRESGATARIAITSPDAVLKTEITSGFPEVGRSCFKRWIALREAIYLGTGKPVVINGVRRRVFPVEDRKS